MALKSVRCCFHTIVTDLQEETRSEEDDLVEGWRSSFLGRLHFCRASEAER